MFQYREVNEIMPMSIHSRFGPKAVRILLLKLFSLFVILFQENLEVHINAFPNCLFSLKQMAVEVFKDLACILV